MSWRTSSHTGTRTLGLFEAGGLNRAQHAICDRSGILVLPAAYDGPSGCLQETIDACVSRDVACKLRPPVVVIDLGRVSMLGAAMPETAVNENRNPRTGKHQVG